MKRAHGQATRARADHGGKPRRQLRRYCVYSLINTLQRVKVRREWGFCPVAPWGFYYPHMQGRLTALGLSLNDVLPARRPRKSNPSLSVKYRSPDGETWSGRGHAPLWLRQLELQGHKREEYAVSEG